MASQKSRIFVGTAVTRPEATGGLFRSTDGGDFELLSDGILTDTGVQALTVHPDDPALIFAATRNGVFRSSNHGDTWTKLPVPLDKRQAWSVTVHPTERKTIVVGTAPIGFLRSDDLGDTWRELGAPPRGERFPSMKLLTCSRTMRISIDPVQPNLWYAATEVNGVFVSKDGGETWVDAGDDLVRLAQDFDSLKNTELTDDDTEGMLDGHAVNVSAAHPGRVYYACRMGLFSSDNGGEQWRDLEITRFSPIRYSRDVRVSPSEPNVLYTCLSISSRSDKGTLFRSDDLGENWRRMDPTLNIASTMMSMGIDNHDGGKVYAVTRAGDVLSTPDGGANWRQQKLPGNAGDAFCITGS